MSKNILVLEKITKSFPGVLRPDLEKMIYKGEATQIIFDISKLS